MHNTIQSTDNDSSMSELFDCINWRIVGSEPNCAINLSTGQCSSCTNRTSRKGNYQNPPVYYVPALHPEVKKMIFNKSIEAAGQGTCCQDKVQESEKKAGMRGLGDVIAAATSAVGVKPCGGCKKRQESLNKMFPFGKPDAGGETKPQ
jgi:hypothetical protein